MNTNTMKTNLKKLLYMTILGLSLTYLQCDAFGKPEVITKEIIQETPKPEQIDFDLTNILVEAIPHNGHCGAIVTTTGLDIEEFFNYFEETLPMTFQVKLNSGTYKIDNFIRNCDYFAFCNYFGEWNQLPKNEDFVQKDDYRIQYEPIEEIMVPFGTWSLLLKDNSIAEGIGTFNNYGILNFSYCVK